MWLMWFISLRIIPLRELGIMHTLEIAYKKVVLGIYYSWKLSEGMYGFYSYDHQPGQCLGFQWTSPPLDLKVHKEAMELQWNRDGGEVDYLMLETV